MGTGPHSTHVLGHCIFLYLEGTQVHREGGYKEEGGGAENHQQYDRNKNLIFALCHNSVKLNACTCDTYVIHFKPHAVPVIHMYGTCNSFQTTG